MTGNKIIEVFYKEGVFDATGEITRHGIADLGISGLESVVVMQLYKIEGALEDKEIISLCENLLADPITQSYTVDNETPAKGGCSIKVWYKPGVTDAAGDSVLKAGADMGIKGMEKVHTGLNYMLCGKLADDDIKKICERLLANTVVQTYESSNK